jgi:quinol monooxygenase YgiN
MTVTRLYTMVAKDGEAGALASALDTLAANTRPLAGCEGVEVLNDDAEANRLVLIERWDSKASHEAGAATRAPSVVEDIVALLAQPVDGSYYRSRSQAGSTSHA